MRESESGREKKGEGERETDCFIGSNLKQDGDSKRRNKEGDESGRVEGGREGRKEGEMEGGREWEAIGTDVISFSR